jgi:hypothetical protein
MRSLGPASCLKVPSAVCLHPQLEGRWQAFLLISIAPHFQKKKLPHFHSPPPLSCLGAGLYPCPFLLNYFLSALPWLSCSLTFLFILLFFFPFSAGLSTQGLMLARQVLYHLSLGSNALPPDLFFFCFSYFSGRFSYFCPGPASSRHPLTCGLLHSWDNRNVPPYLLICRDGILVMFCLN